MRDVRFFLDDLRIAERLTVSSVVTRLQTHRPELQDEPSNAAHHTFRQMRRFAREAGLVLTFRLGMMHEAFFRLDHDAAFSARHTGLVARAQRLLKRTGMLRLLRRMPACLATPMAFEGRRASDMSATSNAQPATLTSILPDAAQKQR